MEKFFSIPFAQDGDRTAIPNATQTSGDVSYQQGYGYDYARDQSTDPLAKNIERDKMNALFHDLTKALGELQGTGVPDFITPDLNGGVPWAYALNAQVRYDGGSGVRIYRSLVADNTALPTDSSKWSSAVAVDVASQAEAVAGADNTKIMTPLRVAQAVPAATEIVAGRVEMATVYEAAAGVDTARAVHPAGLAYAISQLAPPLPAATETVIGKTRYATESEVLAGTMTSAAVHPAGVRTASGSFRTLIGLTGPVTLSSFHIGMAIICGGSTMTLPPAASVRAGATITLLSQAGGGGVTVIRAGSDNIYVLDSNLSVTTAGISAGTKAILVSDGGDYWHLYRGDGGGSQLTPNGFAKLPGGLIIQWGVGSGSGSTSYPITFPTAFPNMALNASATNIAPGTPATYQSIGVLTKTGMSIGSTLSTVYGFYWMAIGY